MKNLIHVLMLLMVWFSPLIIALIDNVTISKDEYNKLKGDTLKSEYPKPFKLYTEGLSRSSYDNDTGIVLGSDNHEYLVWNYGAYSCNVEHYIDCNDLDFLTYIRQNSLHRKFMTLLGM